MFDPSILPQRMITTGRMNSRADTNDDRWGISGAITIGDEKKEIQMETKAVRRLASQHRARGIPTSDEQQLREVTGQRPLSSAAEISL